MTAQVHGDSAGREAAKSEDVFAFAASLGASL